MLICMRTTLELDDGLMRAVKRRAADSGRTMTAIVEESLRAALAVRPGVKRRAAWKWVSVKGRLAPEVDVADRGRLYDLMEGRG
jgi:plasmid stability protein